MKNSNIKYIVGGSVVAAGLICIGIAEGIGGGHLLAHGFRIGAGHVITMEENTYTEETDMKDITRIDIDIDAAKLIIETGDVDKVEISTCGIVDEDFRFATNNQTLNISYKINNGWFNFGFGGDTTIKVIIPDDVGFESVRINHGAGEADITGLKSKKLVIESGAGETNLYNIIAESLECRSGVGSYTVENATVNGLDIKSGVGSFSFTGVLNGNCTLKSGIGEVNLNVDGNGKTFGIRTESGIGRVNVTGSATYGSGDYFIDIDSGIGEVNVNVR